MRILYRTRQFIGGLTARVSDADRREAAAILPPGAHTWFLALPVDLQWHGLNVMRDLRQLGVSDGAVLAAALLHDAGKTEAASGPVPRAVAVLVRKLAPGWAAQHAARDWRGARGLDRVLAVAAQHPAIAADRAAHCGCEVATIELIRRHQDQPAQGDEVLRLFQQVDDRH